MKRTYSEMLNQIEQRMDQAVREAEITKDVTTERAITRSIMKEFAFSLLCYKTLEELLS